MHAWPGSAMEGSPQTQQASADDVLISLLEPVVVAGREGLTPTAEQVARGRAQAALMRTASPGLLYDQLTRALCGRHPHRAMEALQDLDLLAPILPELEATISFSQEGGRRHKDVWEHTKMVVWQSVPRPTVRWAALLHDIGKVPTRRFLDEGRVSFHGHAEVGEHMFLQGPLHRLGFPAEIGERVALLIRLHLRPGQWQSDWSDAALRRFAREAGAGLEDLLNLSRADVTSKRPGRRKQCLANISELARKLRDLKARDAMVEPLPAGMGHVLVQALQQRPGPRIGALKQTLRALCEAGELESGRSPDYYLDALRERALL